MSELMVVHDRKPGFSDTTLEVTIDVRPRATRKQTIAQNEVHACMIESAGRNTRESIHASTRMFLKWSNSASELAVFRRGECVSWRKGRPGRRRDLPRSEQGEEVLDLALQGPLGSVVAVVYNSENKQARLVREEGQTSVVVSTGDEVLAARVRPGDDHRVLVCLVMKTGKILWHNVGVQATMMQEDSLPQSNGRCCYILPDLTVALVDGNKIEVRSANGHKGLWKWLCNAVTKSSCQSNIRLLEASECGNAAVAVLDSDAVCFFQRGVDARTISLPEEVAAEQVTAAGAIWTGLSYEVYVIDKTDSMFITQNQRYFRNVKLSNIKVAKVVSGDFFSSGSVQVALLAQNGDVSITNEHFQQLFIIRDISSCFDLAPSEQEHAGYNEMKLALRKRVLDAEAKATKKWKAIDQRQIVLDSMERFVSSSNQERFVFPFDHVPMVREDGSDIIHPMEQPILRAEDEAEETAELTKAQAWFYGPSQFLVIRVSLILPGSCNVQTLALTLENGETSDGGFRFDEENGCFWVWAFLKIAPGEKCFRVSLFHVLVFGRNLAYASNKLVDIELPLSEILKPGWSSCFRMKGATVTTEDQPPPGSIVLHTKRYLSESTSICSISDPTLFAEKEEDGLRFTLKALTETKLAALAMCLDPHARKDWSDHKPLFQHLLTCLNKEVDKGEDATCRDILATDVAASSASLLFLSEDFSISEQ